MSCGIKMVVGLGNPGPRYADTRHNAGFMLADVLISSLHAGPWKAWHGIGEYAKAEAAGREILLAKPLTFMNESGRMVQSIAAFYKINPGAILVCLDDMSMELGRIRLRRDGSSGGQRGMENIIAALSTQNIPRLKIGVGPKPEQMDAAEFVLSRFRAEERQTLSDAVEKGRQAAIAAVEHGLDEAMNRFNS